MPFTPQNLQVEDALATSQDVYEVQFTDWGVRTVPPGQTAINPNFQWPPPGIKAVPASLAAIAIGPRSTVDRCWVTWDRQKLTAVIPPGPESAGSMTESRPRPLSVGNPISFATATKLGILGTVDPPPAKNNDPVTAMHFGLLYAFPKDTGDASQSIVDPNSTTILPAKYADEAGVIQGLGLTLNPLIVFETPYLELLLYLQEPKISLPTARFPHFVSASGQVTTLNTFELVAQLPIFGRKHIGLGLRNVTHATDYRVGFLRCIRENLPPTTSPPFEVPAGSALAVPAGQAANFSFNNPCADYLNVYAKVAAASFIDVELAAYDY